jgi:hypothetical protein
MVRNIESSESIYNLIPKKEKKRKSIYLKNLNHLEERKLIKQCWDSGKKVQKKSGITMIIEKIMTNETYYTPILLS